MSLVCRKWVPSTRRVFSSILFKADANVAQSLKEALALAKNVSLTVDMQADRKLRTFIGITAHYISQNFEFKTEVLAFKNLESKSTGENIKNSVDEIINSYNIG